MRSRLSRFALATAVLCTAACQTPSPEGAKKDAPAAPTDAKTPPTDAKTPPTDVKTPDATADAAATAAAATAGAATAGPPADTAAVADTPPAADTAAADAAPAGDTAGAAAAPADKAKLIAEIKAKKTSDARTKKALEEAEAAGATVRELAEASNARGVALLNAGEPDRATAAFEWARDKDTTYPDASFNLAKQSANAGDTEETIKHLQDVHKRGGKALLKQVGYDPTFEAVKDDPEIQKIAK